MFSASLIVPKGTKTPNPFLHERRKREEQVRAIVVVVHLVGIARKVRRVQAEQFIRKLLSKLNRAAAIELSWSATKKLGRWTSAGSVRAQDDLLQAERSTQR